MPRITKGWYANNRIFRKGIREEKHIWLIWPSYLFVTFWKTSITLWQKNNKYTTVSGTEDKVRVGQSHATEGGTHWLRWWRVRCELRGSEWASELSGKENWRFKKIFESKWSEVWYNWMTARKWLNERDNGKSTRGNQAEERTIWILLMRLNLSITNLTVSKIYVHKQPRSTAIERLSTLARSCVSWLQKNILNQFIFAMVLIC